MPAPWGLEPPRFPARAPRPPVPIEHRAITLRQLREMCGFVQRVTKVGLLKYAPMEFNTSAGRAGQSIKWSMISMHEICSEIIKNVIPEAHSCSWVELVGRGKTQTRAFFCSHNWGQSFCDFVCTIEHHAREYKVRPDETYWICVFANNQWLLELGETLGQSPFYRALAGSRMTVVMMDKASEVLRRLWCVFEMHETSVLRQGFEFWTPLGKVGSPLVSSGPALHALGNLDVRAASATNEVDQRQIINYIAGEPELAGIREAHEIRPGEAGRSKATRVLDPGCPRHAYEEEVMRNNGGKFVELNAAILKASLGTLIAPDAKKLVFPSWDAEGRATGVNHQVEPVWIPSAENRAISLGQLRSFVEAVRGAVCSNELRVDRPGLEPSRRRILWHHPPPGVEDQEQLDGWGLTELFVRPMTFPSKCSLVELVAHGPQPCDQFVQDVWSSSLKSTMAALEWHAEARNFPDTTMYWMGMFANRLDAPFVEADWGDGDLRTVPFYFALHDSCGLVNILNDGAAEEMAKTYKRLYSVYEAWVAMTTGKSYDIVMSTGAIATTQPFSHGGWEFGAFNAAAAAHVLTFKFKAQEAICASLEDRRKILNAIARRRAEEQELTEHPAYDLLTRRMRERAAGPVLRDAAAAGDVGRLRSVLKEWCPGLLLSSSALCGNLGETPVHAAAAAGKVGALVFLLKRRASANAQDLAGETPLHYAALTGQAEAARELCRRGADAGLASFAGETPLDVAWQRPAYFYGVDARPVADTLMAASHDRGAAQLKEFECRLADEAFMSYRRAGRAAAEDQQGGSAGSGDAEDMQSAPAGGRAGIAGTFLRLFRADRSL